MKKVLIVCALAAVSCLGAEQKKKDAYDIRPEAAKKADAPSAVEWENKHDAELAAATAPAALDAFLASNATAAELIASVKTGYATDALKATQIAAVSQYVMQPQLLGGAKYRIWTGELLKAALAAKEPDVAIFLLDQLRWCGCPKQADEIDAKTETKGKAVKDMGDIVAAELRAAGARFKCSKGCTRRSGARECR